MDQINGKIVPDGCRPDFNDFVRAGEPPLDFNVPSSMFESAQSLMEAEVASGRRCLGGFLKGGVFLSCMRGNHPNDIDVQICAPDLIEEYKKIKAYGDETGLGFREYRERQEDISFMISDLFAEYPFQPFGWEPHFHIDMPLLGDTLSFRASIKGKSPMHFMDVICSTNPVDPVAFFAHTGEAPITNVAYDFDKAQYIYHRDFPEHAQAWRYEPYSRVPEGRLEKARDKGMHVVI